MANGLEAKKLRELITLTCTTVENTPEYKKLPPVYKEGPATGPCKTPYS
jgi:hypothetical protein